MADEPTDTTYSANDMAKVAALYHVPISPETTREVAGDSASAEKYRQFEQYVQTAAQGLYPTLAPQIKAGIPTSYLLDPYRQVAKQMLGDQFEPDFTANPRDTQALEGGRDPQTGRPAPMTLEQWRNTIATDPRFGYDKTPHAVAAAQYAMSQLHDALTQPGGPHE